MSQKRSLSLRSSTDGNSETNYTYSKEEDDIKKPKWEQCVVDSAATAIPTELWIMILQYLQLADKIRLSRVNRRMYMISRHPDVWRHLDLTDSPYKLQRSTKAIRLLVGSHTRIMSVRGYYSPKYVTLFKSSPTLSSALLKLMTSSCNNLQRITLINCSVNQETTSEAFAASTINSLVIDQCLINKNFVGLLFPNSCEAFRSCEELTIKGPQSAIHQFLTILLRLCSDSKNELRLRRLTLVHRAINDGHTRCERLGKLLDLTRSACSKLLKHVEQVCLTCDKTNVDAKLCQTCLDLSRNFWENHKQANLLCAGCDYCLLRRGATTGN